MSSYIFVGNDALSLSINNKAYNVDSTHPNWDNIVNAVKEGTFDIIPDMINVSKTIADYVKGHLSNIEVNIEHGTISYAGSMLNNALVDQIFRMHDQGFDIQPMVHFLDNLMSNPSKRAVDELYGFLQYGKLPLTPDGCFIAYKRVRDDYKSVHDGITDNSIGTVLTMPRNMVNEDSNQTCSTGLHFCSHEYLKNFSGNRVVILKVNPRDVVSIPADYNNTKGRACQYEVIGELSEEDARKALMDNVFDEAVYVSSAHLSQPKKGTSAFFYGYHTGYEDVMVGNPHNEYTDMYGRYGRQADNYEDGYVQGYEDSYNGEPMRYMLAAS